MLAHLPISPRGLVSLVLTKVISQGKSLTKRLEFSDRKKLNRKYISKLNFVGVKTQANYL